MLCVNARYAVSRTARRTPQFITTGGASRTRFGRRLDQPQHTSLLIEYILQLDEILVLQATEILLECRSKLKIRVSLSSRYSRDLRVATYAYSSSKSVRPQIIQHYRWCLSDLVDHLWAHHRSRLLSLILTELLQHTIYELFTLMNQSRLTLNHRSIRIA